MILDDKRKYLLEVYAGKSKLLRFYWSWRIARMSEGEVLERFYEYTE